jgi:5-methylcytosine-specific restriction endonuclease McrA
MSVLNRVVAAHPLASQEPYNRIKFSRVDGNGAPLYKVGHDKKEHGAAAALRSALEKYGANCFHCDKHMPKQKMSHDCTRDHLRPKAAGGGDYLHNLVFACGDCNRRKGSADLISFRPEAGSKYLKALDEHLARCLKQLNG